jgi:hypothetical protein
MMIAAPETGLQSAFGPCDQTTVALTEADLSAFPAGRALGLTDPPRNRTRNFFRSSVSDVNSAISR